MGKLTAFVLVVVDPRRATDFRCPAGKLYDTAGSGDTVVLLHGAFMDCSAWDRQFSVFAKQFRVVRYDIRPFGESSLPQKAYSTSDDLLRLLDHLKVTRAHLVGHSFGGGVAVDFALEHPSRVASLVLVGAGPTGFVPPADEVKMVGAIFAAVKDGDDAIISAWLKHPMWAVSQGRPGVIQAIESGTRRNLRAFRMAAPPFAPLTPPAVGRLGEIKAPTLVVVGDKDTPGNRQASDVLAKQIAGATLRVVAGADHGLPLGWADELNAAALSFLAAARR